jgi:hypothetical protein
VGKRAEAQMRVVVNEACDDDYDDGDGDGDGVGGRQMRWVCHSSLFLGAIICDVTIG